MLGRIRGVCWPSPFTKGIRIDLLKSLLLSGSRGDAGMSYGSGFGAVGQCRTILVAVMAFLVSMGSIGCA